LGLFGKISDYPLVCTEDSADPAGRRARASDGSNGVEEESDTALHSAVSFRLEDPEYAGFGDKRNALGGNRTIAFACGCGVTNLRQYPIYCAEHIFSDHHTGGGSQWPDFFPAEVLHHAENRPGPRPFR
jgi:hypothetical protein